MKWPSEVVIVRHGESTFNVGKQKRANDKIYRLFEKCFDRNSKSISTKILARIVKNRHSTKGIGNWNTPLTPYGRSQARQTGEALKNKIELPDVIYVSPYIRTLETLECMIEGWSELGTVPIVYEERIREQEHGLATIYNYWKVFHTLKPEQKELYDKEGAYWYQFPQGENVPMVRERVKSWIETIIREHSNKKVLVITHHLTLLSWMATIHRWGYMEFIDHDKNHKPINCGVTRYIGDPKLGKDGKLFFDSYNEKLYK